MKNPIKIIHKFKNSNRRTQYKIYIFVGSLVSNDILKILKSIEDKDFISSYQYLEKNMIVKLEEYYGLKWY
jgi:ribosomal protein S8